MSLIEQINEDFIIAYKAKNMSKKDFLGVLKTEVTKESKIPDDAYIVSKIKSMIKNAAATNSLTDEELEILNKYLPKQMSDSELRDVIDSYIKTEGLTDIKQMGQIMNYLKTNYEGQYNGSSASVIIKEILTIKN